jgi:hypothetical protein
MSGSFEGGTPGAFCMRLKLVAVENFTNRSKTGEPFRDPKGVVEAQ